KSWERRVAGNAPRLRQLDQAEGSALLQLSADLLLRLLHPVVDVLGGGAVLRFREQPPVRSSQHEGYTVVVCDGLQLLPVLHHQSVHLDLYAAIGGGRVAVDS